MKQILLEEIPITIALKNIKTIRLTVSPPFGEVKISAPISTGAAKIHSFVTSKLAWIKKHRSRILKHQSFFLQQKFNHKKHHLWGKSYSVQLEIEPCQKPKIEIKEDKILLFSATKLRQKEVNQIIEDYRLEQFKQLIPSLFGKWEKIVGVKANRISLRKMKTRWGSCSIKSRNIRLNTELAKRPVECLEYVVLHELAHLIEASHNHRFVAIMSQFMPEWKTHRATLKTQVN